MNVMIDLCIAPLGVGTSVSPYIVECQKIFKKNKLSYSLHGYGTNVEGPWDEVMSAVKECHKKLHEMGAPRITSSMRLGTRTDREQSIQDKIQSVEEKLK
jgi:uncharacterized protein (TIGR00106 family)